MPDSPDAAAQAERLHRQMVCTEGSVPSSLASPLYDDGELVIARDAFLFATPGGARFHYRAGRGITYACRGGRGSAHDFDVYLWGTVFGAVAWFNGYFPLHASAVAVGDRIVAFTAESGGGKSTLAAALSAAGLPHVCDDTLPLVHAAGAIVGVPDRKPLKLWEDSLLHLGAVPVGTISAVPGKFYAEAAVSTDRVLPLTDLFLLEPGDRLAFERVTAASDILRVLADALYRPMIPAALDYRAGHMRWMMDLAKRVRVWRITRPTGRLDGAQFAAIARWLREDLPPG